MSRLSYLSRGGELLAAKAEVGEAVRSRDVDKVISALSNVTLKQAEAILKEVPAAKMNALCDSPSEEVKFLLGKVDLFSNEIGGKLMEMIENDEVYLVETIGNRSPAYVDVSWHERVRDEFESEDDYQVYINDLYDRLFGSALFALVKGLKLSNEGGDVIAGEPNWTALASRFSFENFSSLKRLHLQDAERDSAKLLRTNVARQLERLSLQVSDGSGCLLLEQAELENLEKLELYLRRGSRLDNIKILTDLRIPNLRSFSFVVAGEEMLDREHLELIAGAKWFEGLMSLYLQGLNLDNVELVSTLFTDQFRPKKLGLGDYKFDDAFIEELSECGVLTDLEAIHLNGRFTNRSLEVLAKYALGQLTNVTLFGDLSGIDEQGLWHFYKDGKSNLQSLTLKGFGRIGVTLAQLCRFINKMPNRVNVNFS